MAYSTGYPTIHTFSSDGSSAIEYSISIGTTEVYQGKILPYNTASATIDIDIAPICAEYLDTFYEDMNLDSTNIAAMPTSGLFGSMNTFTVNVEDVTTNYPIVYDYNTDHEQPLADIRYLNDPIDDKVDPRQRIFTSGYNTTGSQVYTYQVNTGNAVSVSITNTSNIHLRTVNLHTLGLSVNDTITMGMTGYGTNTYTVVRPCRNRFALYYVNKYGGLDALLCSGRSIESWSPTRTDVTLYDDRLNRRDWQQKRIYSEQDHQFQLNTGWLTDTNARKIDHLIYSPKVWLHDLEDDTITSCLITDTNYSVKERRYDTVVQYVVNVKLSQKEIRR